MSYDKNIDLFNEDIRRRFAALSAEILEEYRKKLVGKETCIRIFPDTYIGNIIDVFFENEERIRNASLSVAVKLKRSGAIEKVYIESLEWINLQDEDTEDEDTEEIKEDNSSSGWQPKGWELF